MYCPICDGRLSVIESREKSNGTIVRRRRECEDCGTRFTTLEQIVPTKSKRAKYESKEPIVQSRV
jgi:transcriptional repressor NrdR